MYQQKSFKDLNILLYKIINHNKIQKRLLKRIIILVLNQRHQSKKINILSYQTCLIFLKDISTELYDGFASKCKYFSKKKIQNTKQYSKKDQELQKKLNQSLLLERSDESMNFMKKEKDYKIGQRKKEDEDICFVMELKLCQKNSSRYVYILKNNIKKQNKMILKRVYFSHKLQELNDLHHRIVKRYTLFTNLFIKKLFIVKKLSGLGSCYPISKSILFRLLKITNRFIDQYQRDIRNELKIMKKDKILFTDYLYGDYIKVKNKLYYSNPVFEQNRQLLSIKNQKMTRNLSQCEQNKLKNQQLLGLKIKLKKSLQKLKGKQDEIKQKLLGGSGKQQKQTRLLHDEEQKQSQDQNLFEENIQESEEELTKYQLEQLSGGKTIPKIFKNLTKLGNINQLNKVNEITENQENKQQTQIIEEQKIIISLIDKLIEKYNKEKQEEREKYSTVINFRQITDFTINLQNRDSTNCYIQNHKSLVIFLKQTNDLNLVNVSPLTFMTSSMSEMNTLTFNLRIKDGAQYAEMLMKSIQNVKNLISLSFQLNKFSKNKYIEDEKENYIGYEGAQSIVNVLKQCQTFIELNIYLYENNIDYYISESILDDLKESQQNTNQLTYDQSEYAIKFRDQNHLNKQEIPQNITHLLNLNLSQNQLNNENTEKNKMDQLKIYLNWNQIYLEIAKNIAKYVQANQKIDQINLTLGNQFGIDNNEYKSSEKINFHLHKYTLSLNQDEIQFIEADRSTQRKSYQLDLYI
ncbi:hypothetical protein ABPG72_020575, partial [Tetrahymena utriculariae]